MDMSFVTERLTPELVLKQEWGAGRKTESKRERERGTERCS